MDGRKIGIYSVTAGCAHGALASRNANSELRGLIAARTAVMAAVAAIDADMRRMTKASEACRRLMTIPSVGQLTALAFVAAIDDPSRLRRSRDVGAYLGLVPKRYQSGVVDYVGGSQRGRFGQFVVCVVLPEPSLFAVCVVLEVQGKSGCTTTVAQPGPEAAFPSAPPATPPTTAPTGPPTTAPATAPPTAPVTAPSPSANANCGDSGQRHGRDKEDYFLMHEILLLHCSQYVIGKWRHRHSLTIADHDLAFCAQASTGSRSTHEAPQKKSMRYSIGGDAADVFGPLPIGMRISQNFQRAFSIAPSSVARG